MPSLDIVSRVDMQEVLNTVNNTKKLILNRYDFKGTKTTIDLDEKEKKITIVTEDKIKMEAIRESLLQNAVKRKVDLKSLQFGEPTEAGGSTLRREVKIAEGIEQPIAKKIVKIIKDTKIKVQASIQGDEVRLSGKKIDDLRECMNLLNSSKLEVPLQFVNMKS